ncbi:MAG: hypothetical protein WCP16_03055 [Pseudanabaena sp. ELA645]|jgi:hypothetical protein
MVKTLLSASLMAIASLLAAVPAHAISFTWQFTPDVGGPTGANPYVVKGTIDGLVIGSNSGAGITATVTDTPTGELLGTYLFESSGGGNAFTVDAGGNVTFASASFTPDGTFTGFEKNLYLGGYGVYYPQLVDNSTFSPNWLAPSGQTTFSSAPTAVPFDFEPTSAVVILGGIFAAKKLRNKLIKK